MKFSVLLPTRNRLDLLKGAIRSVLLQDYDNWEIIVSDNCSDEDVAGYVASLNDSRIKYFRTLAPVAVTENWNYSLEQSSGDYIIMLGDDDSLLKGYFTTICGLLDKYPNPDLIYTSGFTYAYPGALKELPAGFLNAFGNASFLQNRNEPFWLSNEQALKLVKDSMNFKVMFAYNMQYGVISRKIIEKLKSCGHFFQSPYPDYYSMTSLFLLAERLLVCPKPMIVVGISPKSYGSFYFNQADKQGEEFLKNLANTAHSDLKEQYLKHVTDKSSIEKLQETILPGTTMNTFWLLSMEIVKNNFFSEIPLTVNYSRYRLLQIFQVYKNWMIFGKKKTPDLRELLSQMTRREKILYGVVFRATGLFLKCIPKRYRPRIINKLGLILGSHPVFSYQRINQTFSSIQQVFDEINPAQHTQSN
jgi:glycosyltransferase involved in cell wall biosynthesis